MENQFFDFKIKIPNHSTADLKKEKREFDHATFYIYFYSILP